MLTAFRRSVRYFFERPGRGYCKATIGAHPQEAGKTMEFGSLKPLLTSLVLPPTSLLLLIGLGLLLAARKKAGGLLLAFVAATMLWLLSCHAVASWLALNLLPQYPPLSVAALKASPVQAIVVLGGGVYPQAPEYGEPQAL